MKSGTKVTHVTVLPNTQLKGIALKRCLFDGKESYLGIQMTLGPIGVLCDMPGKELFVLPFAMCMSICLERKAEEKEA